MNMKKLTPLFLVLIFCFSVVAYISPRVFPTAESLAYLFAILAAPTIWIFILESHGFEVQKCNSSKMRILFAIVFYIIFMVVGSRLVRFYLNYSFVEPFGRFMYIWAVALFAFLATAFILSPMFKISKKTSEK